MAHLRFMTAIIAATVLAACSSQPPRPAVPERLPTIGAEEPYLGNRLTQTMIEDRLSGRTLYGCYPSGEAWAERYNEDGTLQDMQQGGLTVGTWYATPLDEICFKYDSGVNAGQPPYCFIVSEDGEGLHYYVAGVGTYAASTSCPMNRQQDYPYYNRRTP